MKRLNSVLDDAPTPMQRCVEREELEKYGLPEGA